MIESKSSIQRSGGGGEVGNLCVIPLHPSSCILIWWKILQGQKQNPYLVLWQQKLQPFREGPLRDFYGEYQGNQRVIIG
ncbi:predicted protein [Sclerotinia sclerotiorum 1980 UF-70]|uniref:Uncharacterized protein n=1 Tax=Sclerotinia sclerotiorum (strain ATCC 18683 / 1980 / Ss-1) TaxID=665079 RepID=A7EBI2_SCLS1|nr:predicted protein [Sclerotinia sclerotiorum 1980 UF-70]EDN99810.1 predicted protein [Sclerotinia sclerotiorum 1980 UF-70]